MDGPPDGDTLLPGEGFLTPWRRTTLKQAIAYIWADELVEVTQQSIRLRKRYLDPHERKKASRRVEG